MDHKGKRKRDEGITLAALDLLTAHIAVLDHAGRILAVNKSWLDFARENGGQLKRLGIGVICEEFDQPEL
jgi:hypothetical protein